MRGFGQLLLAGGIAAATFTSAQTPAPPASAQTPGPSAGAQTPASSAEASRVMAAAREALGGEARLSAVKSIVATGRTRQIRGDNLVPIEFEILFELPDKYVRKDEIPAQESGPTSLGFKGDELIQQPAPPPPPAGRAGSARTDSRTAGCRTQGASRRRQTGLRAAHPRDVCRLVQHISRDLHVRRPGRSAAGQGGRDRRQGTVQLRGAAVRQQPDAPADHGELAGAERPHARHAGARRSSRARWGCGSGCSGTGCSADGGNATRDCGAECPAGGSPWRRTSRRGRTTTTSWRHPATRRRTDQGRRSACGRCSGRRSRARWARAWSWRTARRVPNLFR